MPTRFQFVGIGLALALAWAVMEAMSSPEVAHAKAQATPTAERRLSTEELAAHHAADHRETEIRIAELTRLQTARANRQKAAAKMPESRRFLQTVYGAQWAKVLTTNWPTFLELRAQAAQSPSGEITCTICLGRQYLEFCVLCPDHKGQCVTCRGSGRAVGEEVCPTCLGNGQCYLCFGLGQMPCPFCNDGMVVARRPLPPNFLPID